MAERTGERSSSTGWGDWLNEELRQHRGNADVLRQELQRRHGMTASLRTVERAVERERQQLVAEQVATIRFETPPGE